MTHLRTPKIWLLTTATLVFGSQATAQNLPNYQVGAPVTVAAAPSLPNIPSEQIARDVISEINPRTGLREFIAAPYDPLEEDPTTAGSLRLRSADGAVTIDGQQLRDGAIVELDFYYNSPSDDPYGGRNYGEVAFVNGELTPVVLRDSRILECSTRVENVVYDHVSYYDPVYSAGIYRPYRHYSGFSNFGLGFGSSFFGPGIGFFDSRRAFGNSSFFGNNRALGNNFRNRRSSGFRGNNGTRTTRRNRDADNRRGVRRNNFIGTANDEGNRTDRRERRNTRRLTNRDSADNTRRNFDGAANGDRNRADRRERRNDRRDARRLTDRDIDERLNRSRIYYAGQSNDNARRNSEAASARRALSRSREASDQPVAPQASSQAAPSQAARSQASQPQTQASRQRTGARRAQPRNSDNQRAQAQRSERSSASSSSPKRQSGNRSTSQPKSASKQKSASKSRSTSKKSSNSRLKRSSAPKRSSTPKRSSSRSSSRNERSRLNFFPNDGFGGVNGVGRSAVATLTSVDCAREEKLRVFIPNARLDAARFDGLTLIALDAQGGETPIYLPPNYIEGYRLAATGQVRPQGYPLAPPTPQYSTPQYSTPVPRFGIEAAPCPNGTVPQADGTCLQSGNVGYPTR